MLHTTEVMAIFVIFWPILSKIWLPWQRPLDPCNQKCLLRIGRPRKPSVISNHILAISHRNAFICIYRILVPKLVAMVTPLCPLCTGVSKMNSPMTQTLSQNQTLHGYVAYNWSYGHFCDFLAYFVQNLVAMACPLDPCNQKCLLRIGRPRKPPVISNHILAISHRNAFMAILVPK